MENERKEMRNKKRKIITRICSLAVNILKIRERIEKRVESLRSIFFQNLEDHFFFVFYPIENNV